MVTLIPPRGLGCAVIATAIVQSLEGKVNVKTRYPSLFNRFNLTSSAAEPTIDLRRYLDRQPHQHGTTLLEAMYECAEEQLGHSLPRCEPRIPLSEEELQYGIDCVAQEKKPVIWVQTESASKNKDWPFWQQLTDELEKDYAIVDMNFRAAVDSMLSINRVFKSIAITRFAAAGITLDTFMLHASQAVGAKNVIAIVGSSNPETVAGNAIPLYADVCPLQPCGQHGYTKLHPKFKGHASTRCYFDDFHCMKAIRPHHVAEILAVTQGRNDLVGYEALVAYMTEHNSSNLQGDLLEIGAFLGGGTAKLAAFAEKSGKKVHTIETFEPFNDNSCITSGLPLQTFYKAVLQAAGDQRAAFNTNTSGYSNIVLHPTNSAGLEFSPAQEFCFSFIDGNHEERFVKNDFELAWKHTVAGGTVAVHDYKRELPHVTRTIDGILKTRHEEISGYSTDEQKGIVYIRKN